MKQYTVRISEQAYKDVENLQFIIADLYKSPITAGRYVAGIIRTINSLAKSAESYPVSTLSSILQYGTSARRIN